MSSPTPTNLPSLLSLALPFLRSDPSSVPSDPSLPSLLSLLRSADAGPCWHKHGTFLSHLSAVHRILTLWRSPLPVSRCGLFHSAYSNSYVNLAIFPPSPSSRSLLRSSLGPAAERLVHLFCSVPRHHLLHHLLLNQFSDHRDLEKIDSVIPPEGFTVKHIRTGEDVRVSRRVLAAFFLITMADFSEQLFGFQDKLFGNDDGRLDFAGSDVRGVLWPGDGKPGLWMNSVSRMGAIYKLIVMGEEGRKVEEEDEGIELVVPPVFENCTRVLGAGEERRARDLYWAAVAEEGGGSGCEEKLRESCETNPYVGEPHVVLAQVYLGEGRWEEAAGEAEKGLRLLLEWGTAWDKRVGWDGWVAWGRVLLGKAREKDWPQEAWGVINLGLVR